MVFIILLRTAFRVGGCNQADIRTGDALMSQTVLVTVNYWNMLCLTKQHEFIFNFLFAKFLFRITLTDQLLFTYTSTCSSLH